MTDTLIGSAVKESSLGLKEKVQWNVDLNLDLFHNISNKMSACSSCTDNGIIVWADRYQQRGDMQ